MVKPKVKFFYKYDDKYDVIYPTDAIAVLTKIGDVELLMQSESRLLPTREIYYLDEAGALGESIEKTDCDGKKIDESVIQIERTLHEKIVLKPTFAIDTAMALIDVALASPIAIDKEKVKEKLTGYIEKLK